MKFLKNQPDEKLLKKNAVEKEFFWDLDDVDDDDDEKKENEKNQRQNAPALQQVSEFPEQPAFELKKIRELMKNDFFINHENYTSSTNQTTEKSKKKKTRKFFWT